MGIRPLRRSISTICALFFLALSLVLSIVTYILYSSSMYKRYENELTSVADFLETQIDNDDMAECARTNVESATYRATQAFFDSFIDKFDNVHSIYLMELSDPGDPVQVRVICSANSSWKKEHEPENVLHLGDGEPDWYNPNTIQKFRNTLKKNQTAFFRTESTLGIAYSFVKPMFGSNGDCYGLLCVNLPLTDLNEGVYRDICINITIIILSAVFFILLMLLWMRKNVTDPLLALEQNVTDFAKTSEGTTNPDELGYRAPNIQVDNEVLSLSNSITKLADNMRDYATKILATEQEQQRLRDQVFLDALTKVKSNAAYREKTVELQASIENGDAEFALVMVDINRLKKINDQFGHEFGDEYIIGAARQVSEVFSNSPIYRIGGDEFVAVLTGEDYDNRDALCKRLKDNLSEPKDVDYAPWQQYSASVGMSVFRKGDDVSAVFDRADQAMYREKLQMKAKLKQDPTAF